MTGSSLAAQRPAAGALVLALALCAPCAVMAQPAQGWPTKPVRIIVPTSPGGGTDSVTRVLSIRVGDPL